MSQGFDGLLLIGEQRSGTTLLTELLDDQPGIRVRFTLFAQMLEPLSQLGVTPTSVLTSRQRHLAIRSVERALLQMGRPAALAMGESCTLRDVLWATLELARDDSATVVGSKEHGPASYMNPLLRDGRLRILYIVRDARDVVLSRFYRGDSHIDQKIQMWQQSVRVALAIDHPNFALVRYEDLVRRPAEVMSGIGSSFGWPIDGSRAAMWRAPEGRPVNSSFHRELGGVSTAPVERWRGYEQDPWVRMTSMICARELGRLGYARGPALGRRERVQFAGRWARVRGLHAGGRLRRWAIKRFLPPLAD